MVWPSRESTSRTWTAGGGSWPTSSRCSPSHPGASWRCLSPATQEQSEFTELVEPTLLTAAIGRLKDLGALNEVRVKAKGKGKKGDKEQDE